MQLVKRHLATAIAVLVAGSGSACAQNFGPWGDPTSVTAINTAAAEGCPIETPDGLGLYFASSRSGGLGKQDVWRAFRASVQSTWGAAENLAAPVNSPEFDYCPTPISGNRLLFVSSQQTADDCYPGNTPP
ncbi:MAG: PD40 domain-containing protein, partial [Proteobacteria bacterium]|nr:PD40 domain-containing protein [Pseudomonadota bacterium]